MNIKAPTSWIPKTVLFTVLLLLPVGRLQNTFSQNVFYVDTWFDDGDANPGDGVCATAASECTLRAAIEEANSLPNAGEPDVISFEQIPLIGGVAVIVPQSGLEVFESVVINGTTASGEIILDGADSSFGIVLLRDESTIKGLTFINFSTALFIVGNNNAVKQNYFGATRDGTDFPNGTSVVVSGENNKIGGVGEVSSFYDMGNGNVIVNSVYEGIHVSGNGNILQRNFIGLDLNGQNKGNINMGIYCTIGQGNVFGGPSPAHGNRVGYNGLDGFFIEAGVALYDCDNSFIRNNYIGTDHAGRNLGNGGAGIYLRGESDENRIGGNQGRGNVIGFNETGIYVEDSSNNTIQGNYIGVNRDGEPVGNADSGIAFLTDYDDVVFNVIGYTVDDTLPLDLEKGNSIAYNGGPGITFLDQTAIANPIRGNALYDNGGLGIDLGGDGQSLNDLNDVDTGTNRLQNYPEILRAFYRAGNNIIAIEFTVSAHELYAAYPLTIDAYIADDANSGEGKTYIGSVSYENPDSVGTFEIPADNVSWSLDDVIVLTATDADHNTSEFSPASTPLSDGDGGPLSSVNVESRDLLKETPAGFTLSQPYPNPFNPQSTFTLSISEPGAVRITMHDVQGRQVAALHDGYLSAGTVHTFTIDGSFLASGTYLLRVEGAYFTQTRRLSLLK